MKPDEDLLEGVHSFRGLMGNIGDQGQSPTIVQDGMLQAFTTTNAPISNYYSSTGQSIQN